MASFVVGHTFFLSHNDIHVFDNLRFVRHECEFMNWDM